MIKSYFQLSIYIETYFIRFRLFLFCYWNWALLKAKQFFLFFDTKIKGDFYFIFTFCCCFWFYFLTFYHQQELQTCILNLSWAHTIVIFDDHFNFICSNLRILIEWEKPYIVLFKRKEFIICFQIHFKSIRFIIVRIKR